MLTALIGPIAGLLDKFIPDADLRTKLAHEVATMAESHAQEIALAQIKVSKFVETCYCLGMRTWISC